MIYDDYGDKRKNTQGPGLHRAGSGSPFSSEVDFILGDHTAVEVKAKENVSAHDLKSLRAFAEEKKLKRYLCMSLEPPRRKLENVTILPLRDFLEALWSREYSS